jgi:redox-sensitive bicupin YhaK (pirin superfamily)
MVTYVVEGTLSHRGVGADSSLLRAGDFQRSSVPHSDHVSYANASGSDPLHVLQLSLGGDMSHRKRIPQQKSFPVADRSAAVCLVGSQDGRQGSLLLDQDVLLYSCVLGAGQSIVHTLGEGRMAWMHVVRGEVNLGETVLLAGDGAGVCLAPAFTLSAGIPAEVVLLDLGTQTTHRAAELGARPLSATRAA